MPNKIILRCCLFSRLPLFVYFLLLSGHIFAQKNTAIVESAVLKNLLLNTESAAGGWLNGYIDKEIITRELQGMRSKGFSRACIFDANGADQAGNGPVPQGLMFGSTA